MKTAEEILREKFKNNFLDFEYLEIHLEAMQEYAKQEAVASLKEAIKLCNEDKVDSIMLPTKRTGDYRIALTKAISIMEGIIFDLTAKK